MRADWDSVFLRYPNRTITRVYLQMLPQAFWSYKRNFCSNFMHICHSIQRPHARAVMRLVPVVGERQRRTCWLLVRWLSLSLQFWIAVEGTTFFDSLIYWGILTNLCVVSWMMFDQHSSDSMACSEVHNLKLGSCILHTRWENINAMSLNNKQEACFMFSSK